MKLTSSGWNNKKEVWHRHCSGGDKRRRGWALWAKSSTGATPTNRKDTTSTQWTREKTGKDIENIKRTRIERPWSQKCEAELSLCSLPSKGSLRQSDELGHLEVPSVFLNFLWDSWSIYQSINQSFFGGRNCQWMRTNVSPSDEGKPVTKSFEIWGRRLCGTSRSLRSPARGLQETSLRAQI